MSVYKNNSPDALKDYHEVRDYILGINKAVQNVFNSLDPDDNFTEEELNRYNEIRGKISMAELSGSGLRILFADTEKKTAAEIEQTKGKLSMKVRSGDVVNQLNLERGDIVISGNRFEINTTNFEVWRGHAYAKGNITATAGTFGGWTIKNNEWVGGANSKIIVHSINADSGTANTIRGYGPVNLNATAKGNFDTIDFTNSTLSGGFTCSCMEEMGGDKATLNIKNRLYLHTTFRSPGEHQPSSRPQYPDEAPYEGSNRKDYNENTDPTGGLLTSTVSCTKCYSKLAGKYWSDRRLKKNIVPIGEKKAAALLDTLIPSMYSMNGSSERLDGYIAQEVPEEYRTTLKSGFYGLRYRSISAVLDVEMKKYTLALNNALLEAENERHKEN